MNCFFVAFYFCLYDKETVQSTMNIVHNTFDMILYFLLIINFCWVDNIDYSQYFVYQDVICRVGGGSTFRSDEERESERNDLTICSAHQPFNSRLWPLVYKVVESGKYNKVFWNTKLVRAQILEILNWLWLKDWGKLASFLLLKEGRVQTYKYILLIFGLINLPP